jgi:hypothetical protein
MTQKEHADAHPLPLHARRIDHPDTFPYPPKVPRKAPTRDSRLTPAWSDSLRPRQGRHNCPLSPLLHTTKGAPMDLNPLQQARQIRMTVRTTRIKAETAYLEAQRKQTWVREQQESLRL